MTNIAREIFFDKSIPVLNATDFLRESHNEIVNMFNDYNRATLLSKKQQIVKNIHKALTINLHLEDDIFYQEVKRTLMEKHWISAIAMEHSTIKYLLAEIEELEVDSIIYDVKVKVLGEQVKNLLKEKQTKLFPKINASKKIDLWRLGTQIAARQSFLENAFDGR